MNARILFLLVCSAAFLADLQCASPRTTAGMDQATAGSNVSSSGANSGETGGKRDSNQTINSRLKRKTLAVDFAVPSLLRYYLADFIKRPLNGDCQTYRGCYTVRANLKMHCIPLQKTISTFVETMSDTDSALKNATVEGQLPFFHKRPMSKVLKLDLTKASRKSNQVVVEIGEDLVRTGCGGLFVHEEAPVLTLEVDLTTIMEWWLGADGGRLRVRLMPEKKAQVAGVEDRYTAAIRAADPRLFLQISSRDAPPSSSSSLSRVISRLHLQYLHTPSGDLSYCDSGQMSFSLNLSEAHKHPSLSENPPHRSFYNSYFLQT